MAMAAAAAGVPPLHLPCIAVAAAVNGNHVVCWFLQVVERGSNLFIVLAHSRGIGLLYFISFI